MKINNVILASWSNEEDRIILAKHSEFGDQWKLISNIRQGRSDEDVKNRCCSLRASAQNSSFSKYGEKTEVSKSFILKIYFES